MTTRDADRQTDGFTLIELLVSIGVIGLLVALLMPAVMSAHDAARRARCGANLQQVATAFQGCLGDSGAFPSASGLPYHPIRPFEFDPGSFMKQFSGYTRVLPFLDQVALYNAVNFGVGCQDSFFGFDGGGGVGSEANSTVAATVLDVLLCPADGRPVASREAAGTNYRMNLGTDRWFTLASGPSCGSLTSYYPTPVAAVLDGTSQTALLCEKLRGYRVGTRLDPRTAMIVGGLGYPYSPEESLAECRARDGIPDAYFTSAGLSWLVGDLPQTCYNHVIGPNGSDPDCILPPSNPVAGFFGARSNHPGGVNVAFADGSIRFVGSAIRHEIWSALGTRAGFEAVSVGDY